MIGKLVGESGALFAAMGIPISCDEIESSTHGTLDATARNFSSMLQDYRGGTGNHELDYINLPLLKAGARHAVEMPTHKLVYERAIGLLR